MGEHRKDTFDPILRKLENPVSVIEHPSRKVSARTASETHQPEEVEKQRAGEVNGVIAGQRALRDLGLPWQASV